jgi:hypothetical protein
MSFSRLRLVAVLLLASFCFSGCAAKGHLNHPNAINAVDSAAYDTLLASQTAIEEAKLGIADHPEAKDVLNQAIAAYDAALPAYKVYHAIGASDPSAGLELSKAMAGLSASIAQLEQVFGKAVK